MFRGSILRFILASGGLTAAAALASGSAWAQSGGAAPLPGAVYFQPSANEMSRQIVAFHDLLLVIITGVTLVVLALLGWVIVRYNRAANPTPRRFSHNTLVEVVWTVVPALILVFIAIYSFPLLAKEENVPRADITIKAIGNAWYWQHEYPDYGGFQVTSNMLPEDGLADRGLGPEARNLAVDTPIVVPVGKTVRVLVTSNDVIHSWSVPSIGVKEDAIPGRVNEGWFVIDRPGTYYGFCQELCGFRHAYMPIEITAVSDADFDRWVVEQGGTLPTAEGSPAPTAAPAGAPLETNPAPAADPAAAPREPSPI